MIFIGLALVVLALKQFFGDMYVSLYEEPAGYNSNASTTNATTTRT